MRLLHTELTDRFLEALAARLEHLREPVVLAPLGTAPGEALIVGMTLSDEEWRLAQDAGVRWIQALPVGVEKVLTPALAASDVVLTSGSGTSATPMAEFVFARILEHAKKLGPIAELQAARTWKQQWLRDLAGATLTIVGLGPTGRAVADLGRAFRMHLVGVRRRPEAGPGICDEVVASAALTDVLPRTDYLVLAPALTPETRGMIGKRELAAMKDGSLLVNVGRGELIDEQALVETLAGGRIRAALDVVGQEPLLPESPLWDAPGLVLSPHSSPLTDSLFTAICDLVARNVARFLDAEPLVNVIDKATGYPLPEGETPSPAS